MKGKGQRDNNIQLTPGPDPVLGDASNRTSSGGTLSTQEPRLWVLATHHEPGCNTKYPQPWVSYPYLCISSTLIYKMVLEYPCYIFTVRRMCLSHAKDIEKILTHIKC